MKTTPALIALLGLLLPALAPAASDQPILDGLRSVMSACPDRVWPGYSWKNFQVIEIGENNRAFALDGASYALSEFKTDALPAHLLESSFAFAKINGSTALLLNAAATRRDDDTFSPQERTDAQRLSAMIDLGAHEAFHGIGQNGWNKRQGARGTEIPILALPRIYRRALYDRLLAAFKDPAARAQHLARARFWHAKWKAEFPREFLMSTDLSEGTAQYVGLITSALAKTGCAASEAELRGEILQIVTKTAKILGDGQFENPVSPESFALDSEGYSLGGLASFLLRFDADQKDWQKNAPGGADPVSQLLADYEPTPDTFDPALRARFENHEKEEQTKTERLLAPARTRLTKTDAVIVSIPSAWSTGGTYSPHGFFFDPAGEIQFIPMRLPMDFSGAKARENGSAVTVPADAVMLDGLSGSPCAGMPNGWLTVVSRSELRAEAGAWALASPNANGRLRGELKRSGDGRDWLCGF